MSDWKAKRDAKIPIEIRAHDVRKKIRAHLLRPERPAFQEGVAYAVDEVRSLLDSLKARVSRSAEDDGQDVTLKALDSGRKRRPKRKGRSA